MSLLSLSLSLSLSFSFSLSSVSLTPCPLLPSHKPKRKTKTVREQFEYTFKELEQLTWKIMRTCLDNPETTQSNVQKLTFRLKEVEEDTVTKKADSKKRAIDLRSPAPSVSYTMPSMTLPSLSMFDNSSGDDQFEFGANGKRPPKKKTDEAFLAIKTKMSSDSVRLQTGSRKTIKDRLQEIDVSDLDKALDSSDDDEEDMKSSGSSDLLSSALSISVCGGGANRFYLGVLHASWFFLTRHFFPRKESPVRHGVSEHLLPGMSRVQ